MMGDEDRLRRDNERLALSLKALGSGVWDYDIDADILVCNDRWYAIVGLDPVRDPIGSISDFQTFVHPDDLGRATGFDLEEINLLIERDERYHREFRILRPDGQVRMVNSVACLIRDTDSGHRRAVGCISDVTVAGIEENPFVPTEPAIEVTGEGGPAVALSARERECLVWVSIGKTAWDTAVILELSRRTVEFHLANAVRKLSAANKVHAAAIAIRAGIL